MVVQAELLTLLQKVLTVQTLLLEQLQQMVVEAEADTQVQVQENQEVLAAVEVIQVQAVQQHKEVSLP